MSERAREAAGMHPKIVVGSGWWCDGVPPRALIGDEIPKGVAFFDLWYDLVQRSLHPARIFVTDSHSPIKPSLAGKDDVVWCELDRNYGHAVDIARGLVKTKYCGFTRSVHLGCAYALSCDADYYVYVEQDCVLRGEGFLDAALAGTTESIVVGQRTVGGRGLKPGSRAPNTLQQSVMIVRREGFERFLSATLAGTESDGELSPEKKMARNYKPFDVLAVPYGRSRPIDFTRSHYYAQHLDLTELRRFLAAEGLDFDRYFGERRNRVALAREGLSALRGARRAVRRTVELLGLREPAERR